ncbi:hypothetical protein DPSP01_011480 [Paraphaeosphaeria sporulosa]|uniref:Large ribosomal subunit protein P1 n=1 Tax=Paraphaeosphaeria sporulosa TaxID=1460663 RepID=A0A177CXC3_9PLEO|nr:uncharacterized protein CC84DRAFT_1159285 [Paraphaeosphaeria sporulosa]OAG11856.1 hypothetical protein CC84DRAFT_1159285 [Paraphaeosphaeria sporulosa]
MSTDATPATASSSTKAETAVSYAALILADDGVEITPEKLQTLLKAANIEDVEPIWTTLFAKALQGKEVKDILTAVSTSAPEVGIQPVLADEKNHDEPNEGAEIIDGGDGNESDADVGMFDLFG